MINLINLKVGSKLLGSISRSMIDPSFLSTTFYFSFPPARRNKVDQVDQVDLSLEYQGDEADQPTPLRLIKVDHTKKEILQ